MTKAQDGPRSKVGPGWEQRLSAGLLFAEVSSLTGENAIMPFSLLARTILDEVEKGKVDPTQAGVGVSFGERQLRAVGTGRRRRRSVSLGDLVTTRRCSC